MSWDTVELASVADINPRMPRGLADDLDVSFLAMAAVSEAGQIDYQEERTVEQVRKGYTYFRRGDVLVAKITPCFENGKATKTDALEAEHGFGSTEFHVIRGNPSDLLPEYAFHLIWNPYFRKEATANMTGSAGQKRVPADFLKRLKIPLPPLEEQRRIAGILDAADALRRRRREAVALLDTLPGAIFAEMFLSPRPGEPDRTTHPLGNLVDAVSGSTPSKGNKAFWDGDIPWISPKDMKSDDLNRAILNITDEATKTGKAKLVGPDVTLIVIRGMILAHSVPICDLRVPASFNQDVKALVPRNGVSNIFVSAALRASRNRLLSLVSNAAHGTKRIEMGDLMKFPIPTATEAEQEKFVRAIAGVAAQRARFEDALHDGEALFASLQSRAFAGEL